DWVPSSETRRSLAAFGALVALLAVAGVALLGAAGAPTAEGGTTAALAAAAPAGTVALVSLRLDRCLLAVGRLLHALPLVVLVAALEVAGFAVRLAPGGDARSAPRSRDRRPLWSR